MSRRRNEKEEFVEGDEPLAEELSGDALAHRELPVEPDPKALDDHEWHEYQRPPVRARQLAVNTYVSGRIREPGEWLIDSGDGLIELMGDKQFRASFIRLPDESE
jgi:hypothetical protein